MALVLHAGGADESRVQWPGHIVIGEEHDEVGRSHIAVVGQVGIEAVFLSPACRGKGEKEQGTYDLMPVSLLCK